MYIYIFKIFFHYLFFHLSYSCFQILILNQERARERGGRERVSLGAQMHLKPALNLTRLPRSRAIAETRVDTWDEIEDREKARGRRREVKNRAANLPPKFGGPS